MNLASINPVDTPAHKGSGMFGSVLGGGIGALIGAIASVALSPYTAGASLAPLIAAGASGAAAGAGLGSTAGGIAGNVIDPAKSPTASLQLPLTEAKKPALSYMMKAPEVQLATMQNAKNLLATQDMPGAMDYMNQLDQAMGITRKRLGNMSSIG